ncbi:hypothetical protein O988_09468, partial [Pseudogymnoascus sp. VKM F-3808]
GGGGGGEGGVVAVGAVGGFGGCAVGGPVGGPVGVYTFCAVRGGWRLDAVCVAVGGGRGHGVRHIVWVRMHVDISRKIFSPGQQGSN